MERRAKVLREGGSFSERSPPSSSCEEGVRSAWCVQRGVQPIPPFIVPLANQPSRKSQTRPPAKQPPPNHGAIKTPTSETPTKEARKEHTTHPGA
ncbi:hypothetical protein JB92DRAFT_1354637 [Gautieria morchelliformis]|nr:hypothetical protein JB92DRAFT_1354637 [Gautieria morchelliformis]